MFLNNQSIKLQIKHEIKNLEKIENRSIILQNLWDTGQASIRGPFMDT